MSILSPFRADEAEDPDGSARRGAPRRAGSGFARFAAFVEAEIGVRLSEKKRTMVDGRLRRRMSQLGISDLDSYFRHLFEDGALDEERTAIFDAVTTNKTDFFRESAHFDHLMDVAAPAAIARRSGTGQPVKVWSAAASTGPEAWSIAMCLASLADRDGAFNWAILATDINTEVLAIARRAIYPESMLGPLRPEDRQRWLMQGHGDHRGSWRIVPELRRRVRFGQLNLMDLDFSIDTDIDVVFLRNVLIYFSAEDQTRLIDHISCHLAVGGTLYLGHSESMVAHRSDLRQVGPATFVKAE
ncbi:CheR family methyltransferase [Rhodovulum visakhapatnamense]|uniref:Chemotaxis protein methyltransferase n=1 Tax=Rhodovulum visakhapatnamense TaxID=364297 RepID=A0A4R8F7W7_9RHOB|nr:CheR family methyltransferase [Rhodovulum visakhapatnamense]TDX21674.1 chemotaxis protein methyltransferase CheR [Rhodovulum visakhapatnamense]